MQLVDLAGSTTRQLGSMNTFSPCNGYWQRKNRTMRRYVKVLYTVAANRAICAVQIKSRLPPPPSRRPLHGRGCPRVHV